MFDHGYRAAVGEDASFISDTTEILSIFIIINFRSPLDFSTYYRSTMIVVNQ